MTTAPAFTPTPSPNPTDPGFVPVCLTRVHKQFRQGGTFVEAVKSVSLTVGAGEFIAVMGASGSGKSTLLHLMAGLTQPTEGQVLVAGTDLATLSDARLTRFRRRRIGIVFQSFNLIPSLTAEQNISLPVFADGRANEIGDRLEHILDRLGLNPRRLHRPDALSGGEQQRVAIARALITDPALILADEPTGSLDSETGQSICRLLRELNQEQGRTIVVVTHEPSVAMWAGRVVVMRDGRIQTEFASGGPGTALELAARYQAAVAPGGRP